MSWGDDSRSASGAGRYAGALAARIAALAGTREASIAGTGFGTAGPCPTTSRVGASLVISLADSKSFALSQVAIWASGKRRSKWFVT